MRREERVTVQGPVKEQQADGMSHRVGGMVGHDGWLWLTQFQVFVSLLFIIVITPMSEALPVRCTDQSSTVSCVGS